MAIIECIECGHGISEFAETCPSCGIPKFKREELEIEKQGRQKLQEQEAERREEEQKKQKEIKERKKKGFSFPSY